MPTNYEQCGILLLSTCILVRETRLATHRGLGGSETKRAIPFGDLQRTDCDLFPQKEPEDAAEDLATNFGLGVSRLDWLDQAILTRTCCGHRVFVSAIGPYLQESYTRS